MASPFFTTNAAIPCSRIRSAANWTAFDRAAVDPKFIETSIAANGVPYGSVGPNTEVTQLGGDAGGRLASISWRDKRTGIEAAHQLRNAFVFIGADPETEWLRSCGLALDKHGFIVTGPAAQRAEGRLPDALESSVPGVFAVGDVRSGSVKRVGGAIGEGAAAVALIHAHLSNSAVTAPR
jgi:thioredoxin reductase (NADPH)